MANILKMFQQDDILKIVLILAGIYLFFTYMQKTNSKALEKYLGIASEHLENTDAKEVASEVLPKNEPQIQQQHIDKIVAGGDQVKPEELLPKYDAENEFAKENPVSKLLKEQNFLISGYHVGINTVSQSNKLAYHDIRSLPPIPKENVGPWNQSSYEQSPAQMRRFFEIGV